MRVHMICQRHGRTALVGPGTPIGELECVDCVAESDDRNRWRPCCPSMNTTCCGHDDQEDTDPLLLAVIYSSNWCNERHPSDDIPF